MSYYGRRDEQGIPVLTAATCILCGIIFLQLQSADTWAEHARWGHYPERAIYEGKPWTMVTSAFVHIEPLHLLFNLYWLWILGGAFERTFGALRWLLFVLSAAFISSGVELATGGAGIGLSGVGYALFGFGWMARRRYPEFARIVTDQTVRMFVGWGLLCVILTKLKLMNIANAAHLGGFLVGAALGALIERPKLRVPLVAGLLALLAISIVPIYWNPLSPEWVEYRAITAIRQRNYPSAIQFLERYLDMGVPADDQAWALERLAYIHSIRGNDAALKATLAELRLLDPEAADGLESDLTKPLGSNTADTESPKP